MHHRTLPLNPPPPPPIPPLPPRVAGIGPGRVPGCPQTDPRPSWKVGNKCRKHVIFQCSDPEGVRGEAVDDQKYAPPGGLPPPSPPTSRTSARGTGPSGPTPPTIPYPTPPDGTKNDRAGGAVQPDPQNYVSPIGFYFKSRVIPTGGVYRPPGPLWTPGLRPVGK